MLLRKSKVREKNVWSYTVAVEKNPTYKWTYAFQPCVVQRVYPPCVGQCLTHDRITKTLLDLVTSLAPYILKFYDSRSQYS